MSSYEDRRHGLRIKFENSSSCAALHLGGAKKICSITGVRLEWKKSFQGGWGCHRLVMVLKESVLSTGDDVTDDMALTDHWGSLKI